MFCSPLLRKRTKQPLKTGVFCMFLVLSGNTLQDDKLKSKLCAFYCQLWCFLESLHMATSQHAKEKQSRATVHGAAIPDTWRTQCSIVSTTRLLQDARSMQCNGRCISQYLQQLFYRASGMVRFMSGLAYAADLGSKRPAEQP